jgi:ribosomal protein S18 acetylase RimI-like enzyme
MKSEELSITRLVPDDLDSLEPLWNALRAYHAAVVPELGSPRPREESWRRRRQQYERWLSEDASFALIAERAGRLVGYTVVHLRDGSPTWPLSDRAGELETLSVLPQERGAGVGSALLTAVREELAQLGATELSLHVVPTSHDALRFYERHGFSTFALWLTSNVPAKG